MTKVISGESYIALLGLYMYEYVLHMQTNFISRANIDISYFFHLVPCEYILGFTPALLNIGSGQQQLSKNSRDGHRAIVDSPELTGYLFEVIKPHLPSIITSNGSKFNRAANVYGGC